MRCLRRLITEDGKPKLFMYHINSSTRNKDFVTFMDWLLEGSEGPANVAISTRRDLDYTDNDDDAMTLRKALDRVKRPGLTIHHLERPWDEGVMGSLSISGAGARQRSSEYLGHKGKNVEWGSAMLKTAVF